MQNFQQILTEAAQLKQHQLRKQRKQFEKQPEFIKSGLNYSKKYEQIRKQHFSYQLRISKLLRKKGNAFFYEQQFEKAQNKYQEALSIFRFITSRSYENMKDQDIQYHQFKIQQLSQRQHKIYNENLNAILLNLSSCLTKQNRKQQAIYSADMALKLNKTAKGHYKKAQAYLQHINRDVNDFKLGMLEMKQAYSISQDKAILEEMWRIRNNFQQQKNKQKKWFKFMFDKNKQSPQNKKIQKRSLDSQKKDEQISKNRLSKHKNQQTKTQQLQKIVQQNENMIKENTKQYDLMENLKKYITQLDDQQWKQKFQADFFKQHSSNIYSLLAISGYKDYIPQYRTVMGKYLSAKTTKQANQGFQNWLQWIKMHPIQHIIKYLQMYEQQLRFIEKKRRKSNINYDKKSNKSLQIKRNQLSSQNLNQQGNKNQLQFITQVKNIVYSQKKAQRENIKEQQSTNRNKLWYFIIIFILIVSFVIAFK